MINSEGKRGVLFSTVGQTLVDGVLETLDDHAILAITDRTGSISYVNERFCSLSKYSEDELLGSNPRIVNSGYHSKAFWSEMWQTVGAGKVWRAEVCNRAKDGSYYWVQTTVRPVVTSEGDKPEAYVTIQTDVTERKAVENNLSESRDKLRWAARAAKIGTWDFELESGKIEWSWMTKIIHGVDQDFQPDLESGISFYTEETRPKVEKAIQKAIEHGEVWDEEWRLRTSQGRLIWVRAMGEAKFEGEKVVRLAGILQDIDDEVKRREAAQRDANLVRNILNSSTELSIVATDVQGIITLFNSGAENALGYTSEEMVGKHTPALFHDPQEISERSAELSEELGQEVEGFDAFVAKPKIDGSETRDWTYVRKDGYSFPVVLVVTPSYDQNGKLEGFLGIARDITERKKAQEDARESEVQFEGAFNASGIGMAIVSLEGKFQRVNASLAKTLGYDADDLLTKTFQQITHPDDLTADLSLLQETIEGLRSSYQMEKRYLHSEGKTIWVKLSVSLVRSKEGKPSHFVSQIEDITAERLLENELVSLSRRLSLAAKAGGIGIWEYDLAGRKLTWDSTLYRLCGREPKVGKNALSLWYESLHPEDLDRSKSDLDLAIEGIKELDSEYRIITPTGSVRHLRAMALVERDQFDRAIRVVGTNWDISSVVKRRNELAAAVEHARLASEAKSRFLANMSHEIRTPMNGVIGMTTLLRDSGGLSDDQLNYVEIVRTSAESLLNIINDILDFSKVEAGKLEIEKLNFEPRKLVSEMADMLRIRAEEKGLEFVCHVEEEVPRFLRGDPGRLRQILINLTNNAIKFTKVGFVRVTLQVLESDAESTTLCFAVCDSGVGIKEEKKQLLFKEFTQADSSTSRLYGGTGLGLAISQKLVQLLGGSISVTSQEGEGSEFKFEIPLENSDAIPTTRKPTLLQDRTALIVSADLSRRGQLEEILGLWDIRTGTCSTAARGLELTMNKLKSGSGLDYVFWDDSANGSDTAYFLEQIKDVSDEALPKLILLGTEPERAASDVDFEYITLPLKQSDVYDALVSGEDPADYMVVDLETFDVDKFVNRSKRVLVAEDNAVNQLVIKGILGKFGVEADCVANGYEVIEALEKVPYDLVFMDVQMPEMDGLEATRRVKEGVAGAAVVQTAIVALTANARKEDKVECLDAGMEDYISKPVDAPSVYRVLDKFLPPLEEEVVKVQEPVTVERVGPKVIFDQEKLLDVMLGDLNLVRQIVELSLPSISAELKKLELHRDGDDFETLRRTVHSLKGASANLRCTALYELSQETDLLIRSGRIEAARKRFPALIDAVKEAKRELSAYLEEKL